MIRYHLIKESDATHDKTRFLETIKRQDHFLKDTFQNGMVQIRVKRVISDDSIDIFLFWDIILSPHNCVAFFYKARFDN